MVYRLKIFIFEENEINKKSNRRNFVLSSPDKIGSPHSGGDSGHESILNLARRKRTELPGRDDTESPELLPKGSGRPPSSSKYSSKYDEPRR